MCKISKSRKKTIYLVCSVLLVEICSNDVGLPDELGNSNQYWCNYY